MSTRKQRRAHVDPAARAEIGEAIEAKEILMRHDDLLEHYYGPRERRAVRPPRADDPRIVVNLSRAR